MYIVFYKEFLKRLILFKFNVLLERGKEKRNREEEKLSDEGSKKIFFFFFV
jgi:hypothetical protein